MQNQKLSRDSENVARNDVFNAEQRINQTWQGSVHNYTFGMTASFVEGLDGLRVEDKIVYLRGTCSKCVDAID